MREIEPDDIIISATLTHYRIKRFVEFDDEVQHVTARNWRRLEADARAYVAIQLEAHPEQAGWTSHMFTCPSELAARAIWPAFCRYDTIREKRRVQAIAKELGKAYASTHPVHDAMEYHDNRFFAWRRGKRLAALRRARGEQTTIPRTYRKVFASAFESGCTNAWACVLDTSAPGWRDALRRYHGKGMNAGDVIIFVMSWFGKLRCVVHRNREWEDTILPSEVALNWRELETLAREAILARYGTLDHIGGIMCPPELAALAIWPGEHKEKEQ